MKIALCLHGLFDSTTDYTSKGEDGYRHIKEHILDRGDVDTFIHSWDIQNQSRIVDLYTPTKYVFEPQKDFKSIIDERSLNSLKNAPRPPFNVLSHFYSIAECIKLPYSVPTKYDIVIKARFDLGRINRSTSGPGLGNKYPVQCINLVEKIDLGRLYMANWGHFHMGPADMWFYGDSSTMKEFTTIYESLHKNFYIGGQYHEFASKIEGNPGDLSNSIAFYKYWMIGNGLWDKKVTLDTVWE